VKIKVINIVNHPPAYEGHRGRPRPEVNWDLPNGSWVGIWGYEWQDIAGNKVLGVADDLEYEVWQPDLRADKIYGHTFKSGLVHKLFPTVKKKFIHGFHLREDLYSEILMYELEKEVNSGQPIIIHLNAGFRFINIPILKKFYKKVPIIGQFYTNSRDIFQTPKTKNILKLINAAKKRFELGNYYRKIKYIVPSVTEGVDYLEKKFGTKVFYRNFGNFGRDFNDWKRDKTKLEARKTLGIDEEKFVMFSSSRLTPIKQIDKMLEVLGKLKHDNFICYISGRGDDGYEKYLNDIIEKNNLQSKIEFIGYVDFVLLKDYYQSADLVISTSYQDAGPAPVSNAAALEAPALLTATGIGYEFYKQHDVGIIVPVDDYDKWLIEIENVINGKEVKIADRKDIEKYGDWEVISNYYYNIYKNIVKTKQKV